MAWPKHATLEGARSRSEKRASRHAAVLPVIALLLKQGRKPEAIARQLDDLAPARAYQNSGKWSRVQVRRIIRRWCDDNGVDLQPKPYSREWDYERFVRAFEGVE